MRYKRFGPAICGLLSCLLIISAAPKRVYASSGGSGSDGIHNLLQTAAKEIEAGFVQMGIAEEPADSSVSDGTPVSGHTLTHVYEQKATCDVPGNNEYWICMDCGKVFSDSHAEHEIDACDAVTNMLGHVLTLVPGTEPSCEIDGNRAYYVCERCGRWYEDGTGTVEIEDMESVIIPAVGHDWGEWTLMKEPDIDGPGIEERVCAHDPSHIETRYTPFQDSGLVQGDVNSDGVLDQRDVVRLMKYITGADVTVAEPALDINGDGEVNTKDMTRLLKLLAGEED